MVSEQGSVPRLIGVFRADQQRERLLLRNNYSHLVVVFDTGIVMVEATPTRDAVARAVNVPFVPHLKLAKHLMQLVRLDTTKFATAEATLTQIESPTPEEIAEAFPGHVRALDDAQIRSAVLRRIPPELRIKYMSREYGRETQIWFKLPLLSSVDEVDRIVSEALGPRLRKAGIVEGMLDAALARLPGS
jgi:hypothetical protein